MAWLPPCAIALRPACQMRRLGDGDPVQLLVAPTCSHSKSCLFCFPCLLLLGVSRLQLALYGERRMRPGGLAASLGST